jgi:hypothetical protein
MQMWYLQLFWQTHRWSTSSWCVDKHYTYDNKRKVIDGYKNEIYKMLTMVQIDKGATYCQTTHSLLEWYLRDEVCILVIHLRCQSFSNKSLWYIVKAYSWSLL